MMSCCRLCMVCLWPVPEPWPWPGCGIPPVKHMFLLYGVFNQTCTAYRMYSVHSVFNQACIVYRLYSVHDTEYSNRHVLYRIYNTVYSNRHTLCVQTVQCTQCIQLTVPVCPNRHLQCVQTVKIVLDDGSGAYRETPKGGGRD